MSTVVKDGPRVPAEEPQAGGEEAAAIPVPALVPIIPVTGDAPVCSVDGVCS